MFILYMPRNGHVKSNHLEQKGANLDFQMATKLQEKIPVAFKLIKGHQDHSNWPSL